MSLCPSEFSVSLLAPRRCRLGASSQNRPLVQSSSPAEVPLVLVLRSHCAVRPTAGCVVFPQRAAPTTVTRTVRPLFEIHLPPEYYPTGPSLPAAAGKLLSWAFVPFSTSGHGDPLTRALPQPATVRLQGLATLLTAFARRARAGFVSHRQRSWDSPFGAFPSRKVPTAFATSGPTCRFSRR
jgi:hypothetical protein